MQKTALVIFLLSLALAACRSQSPEAPTVTQAAPTATIEPGDTPVPTETSIPTIIPSATAPERPTRTPTPEPTATPEGYYENSGAAFSLIYDPLWEISEEDGSGTIFDKEMGFQTFFALSEISAEELSVDEIADEILVGSFEVTYEILERAALILADGTEAERLIISFVLDDFDFIAHLMTPRRGNRQYTFFLLGPDFTTGVQKDLITTMFESISLQGNRLYGVQRDQALVVLGYDPDPEDLDPALTLTGADSYTGLLFSGLVQLSPALSIEPDLAESWTISPDGTIYTFRIRPDAAFSNGEPITAEDVKFSWERAADPVTGSSTAGTYLGDILGVQAKLAGEAVSITGVRVLDTLTLEVTLDNPKPYFLIKLTYPTSFIVDMNDLQADPERWMFDPNASGPYRLKEHVEEDALVFVRNDYYPVPAGIEYVIYLLFRPGTDISYYQAGEIDIAYIGGADAEAIQAPDHPLHDDLRTSTAMCTSYIQFNNTLPPFDDPEVRHAFALAIDRDELNDVFFDGRQALADSLLPPAMPGFSAELMPEAFSVEAAQEALSSSGYAEGLPEIIVIEAGYGDSEDPFLNALITMWTEALDVTIRIEYVDPRDIAASLRAAVGHINSAGWCADYPDPENFLDVLFHSDSQFNFANYSNSEIDSLLETARTELDPALRVSLYKEIERGLIEDYAFLPLFESKSFTLVKPYISGWVDSAMNVPIFDLLNIIRDSGPGD